MKHGGPVALLPVYGQWEMDRIDRQPGFDGRKAGLGLFCLPGQGRAGTIPAEGPRPVGDGLRIDEPLERNIGLGQGEFLALIDEDIPPHGH